MLFAALGVAARPAPRIAYAATSMVAALSQPFRSTVAREDLAALFPQLTNAQLDAALRRNWSSQLLSRTMKENVHRFGPLAIRDRVLPNPAVDSLRPPAILAAFHLGPLQAFSAVVDRLRVETLELRLEREAAHPSNAVIALTNEDESNRVAAFHHAIKTLRAGKFVFLTAEPYFGSRIEAMLFGRAITLARGPFALARLTGAPIIPLVARWRGTRVEIIRGDAIAASKNESLSAAAMAKWLQDYLAANPGEIKPRTFDLFSSWEETTR
jgi:lauroyl/myristoyl acyltransferase